MNFTESQLEQMARNARNLLDSQQDDLIVQYSSLYDKPRQNQQEQIRLRFEYDRKIYLGIRYLLQKQVYNKQDRIKLKLGLQRLKDQGMIMAHEFEELNDIFNAIELEIVKIIKQNELMPNEQQKIENTLNNFIRMLEQVDYGQFIDSIHICIESYGGYKNGFHLKNSDIDVTILTQNFIDERSLLKIIEQYLLVQGDNRMKLQSLTHQEIRVPLLTVNMENTQMDVTINGICALLNTKLLFKYSQMPQVQYFGKMIKLWSKKKGLNSKTMLSSYSWILMGLYFLIYNNWIPSLQYMEKDKEPVLISYKRKEKNGEVQMFDIKCNFYDKELKYDFKKIKEQSLVQLFRQFLYFYSGKGEIRTRNLRIDIRLDRQTGSTNLKDENDENYLFSILDPFDECHNPGNKIKKDQKGKVAEIDNAIKETLKVLESGDDKDSLESIRKLFI